MHLDVYVCKSAPVFENTDVFVFKKANNRFKNELYYFIDDELTEIAPKGFWDDISERNLELWTQSFSSMDAFTSRALDSLRIMWPVAKFVCKNLKVQVKISD